jgi:hypothetical protein
MGCRPRTYLAPNPYVLGPLAYHDCVTGPCLRQRVAVAVA